MFHAASLRSAALFVTIAALSGIAYAAVGPSIGGSHSGAIELSAAQLRASAAATNSSAFDKEVAGALQSKVAQSVLQSSTVKTLTAKQDVTKVVSAVDKILAAQKSQGTVQTVVDKVLTAAKNQLAVQSAVANAIGAATKQNLTKVQGAVANALTATQNQAKVQTALSEQLATPPVQQTLKNVVTQQGFLTQTQASASYVQGQSKIFTGQATSTGGLVTVLTVPGLLHVSATWWPSDGTVEFRVFNDSGGTLDFGGDASGFPYQDTFLNNTTEFGQLSGLSGADGTIASGASQNFQITPRPDAVDLPSQQVPYSAEAHMQVTAPGSVLTTLDLSGFEVAQNNGTAGVGGSALISGQAVVGAA